VIGMKPNWRRLLCFKRCIDSRKLQLDTRERQSWIQCKNLLGLRT
jgi:hypothetical protein